MDCGDLDSSITPLIFQFPQPFLRDDIWYMVEIICTWYLRKSTMPSIFLRAAGSLGTSPLEKTTMIHHQVLHQAASNNWLWNMTTTGFCYIHYLTCAKVFCFSSWILGDREQCFKYGLFLQRWQFVNICFKYPMEVLITLSHAFLKEHFHTKKILLLILKMIFVEKI